ncbi:MAG: hypothetical protein FWE95_07115 [Planctomycetaceae bacterium]|nr:hypothetical protein [Planctomycetaceae bacterium]
MDWIADNIKEIATKLEAEVWQAGQHAIGQLDRKITALQTATLEGNRMANRLEVFAEHLEQTAQKKMEWQQQQQIVRHARAEAAKVLPTFLPTSTPAPETISFNDVLKEIAAINDDVDDVSMKIRQIEAFGKKPEIAALLQPPESFIEPPSEMILKLHEDVKILSFDGLESYEIARKLDISPIAVDLILQTQEEIDTIAGTGTDLITTADTNSTPPSTMSEDFDFAGFEEADAPQSTTSKIITDNFKVPPAFKMGIVGLGQCGNNICHAFYNRGYRRVLLVNTAQTDLDAIKDPIPKLSIGTQGAGKDPAAGKSRVEAKATEIRSAMLRNFGEDFDKIIVCLGLGGGTGSGGGPAVVKIAKDIVKDRGGNPATDVIVFCTLPDPNVEGPRPCFNALVAYGQIANLGVPMIITDNNEIKKIMRVALKDAWTPINSKIVQTFDMFNKYANVPSDLGVLDGNDLNDVISRGRLMFSAFPIRQLDDRYKTADAVATYLDKSLYAKCDCTTASAAGCLMIINPRVGGDLSMEDIAPAFQELNNIMGADSTLHRGIYIPTDWSFGEQDKNPELTCFVVFGGLDHPQATLNGLFEKAKGYDPKYKSVEAFLAPEA